MSSILIDKPAGALSLAAQQLNNPELFHRIILGNPHLFGKLTDSALTGNYVDIPQADLSDEQIVNAIRTIENRFVKVNLQFQQGILFSLGLNTQPAGTCNVIWGDGEFTLAGHDETQPYYILQHFYEAGNYELMLERNAITAFSLNDDVDSEVIIASGFFARMPNIEYINLTQFPYLSASINDEFRALKNLTTVIIEECPEVKVKIDALTFNFLENLQKFSICNVTDMILTPSENEQVMVNNLTDFTLNDCGLTESQINKLLTILDDSDVEYINIDFAGESNAIPTFSSAITSLEGKNNIVTVNEST